MLQGGNHTQLVARRKGANGRNHRVGDDKGELKTDPEKGREFPEAEQINVEKTGPCGHHAGQPDFVRPCRNAEMGASRDIYSLDPYSYGDSYTLSFLNHVYEGLVRYDAELKIEPALAESGRMFRIRYGVFTCAKA